MIQPQRTTREQRAAYYKGEREHVYVRGNKRNQECAECGAGHSAPVHVPVERVGKCGLPVEVCAERECDEC